jgi:transposase
LEFALQAFPKMGIEGRIREDFQQFVRRSGLRIRDHRRHHRPGPPARHRRKRGTQNQAIGRSRGGLTPKIVALTDALGNLARFILLPGQRHDSVGVAPLLKDIDFEALLADKAFDVDWLRTDPVSQHGARLDNRGAQAVIPPKANRKQPIACDFHMYRWRHLIENFFCKLKASRRIATRYEKTDTSFSAMICLVGSAIALR